MAKPPASAMLESVTVPVADVPPPTEFGLRKTLERTGGLIVRFAVFVTVPAVAVIVAVVTVATGMVVTGNVAVVAPWATVTPAGTAAAPLLLVRFTAKPPASAMLEIVTIPVADIPPPTAVGLRETLDRAGGLIVRFAVFVTVPAVAVIVAVVTVATGTVVTGNVAVVAPWATVTLAGTVAAPLLLARFTARPPASAMLESVTVPLVEAPPPTAVGLRETFERTGGLIVSDAVCVDPE
jgi:hypothetical protein